MPGFPLAAIGAGLGLFAKQYQEQQAQKERNAMLQMQMQRFQQEMRDRQGQEELSKLDLGSMGGGMGVQPTPGGASAVAPISGGVPGYKPMPSGGGGAGGGGSGGYWTPAGLDALQPTEGRYDQVHYPSGYTKGGVKSSASGGFGYLDSTWREFAPKAGVDLAQYPRAAMAPEDVQRKVAAITPISHWTGSKDGVPWNPAAQQLARNPAYVTSGGGTPGPQTASAGPEEGGGGAPSNEPPVRIGGGSITHIGGVPTRPGMPSASETGGPGSLPSLDSYAPAGAQRGQQVAQGGPQTATDAGPSLEVEIAKIPLPTVPQLDIDGMRREMRRQAPHATGAALETALQNRIAHYGPQATAAYNQAWKLYEQKVGIVEKKYYHDQSRREKLEDESRAPGPLIQRGDQTFIVNPRKRTAAPVIDETTGKPLTDAQKMGGGGSGSASQGREKDVVTEIKRLDDEYAEANPNATKAERDSAHFANRKRAEKELTAAKTSETRSTLANIAMRKLRDEHPEWDGKDLLRESSKVIAQQAIDRRYAGGQGANQMNSLNTVADHLKLMSEYSEALRTGVTPFTEIPRLNQIIQRLAVEAGKPEVTNFNVARDIMADEVVRLLTSTGGTEADRAGMQSRLSAMMSTYQQTGSLDAFEKFVAGRFKGLEQGYARNDPERVKDFRENLLTPEARTLFTKHGTGEGGAAPATQPGQTAPAATQGGGGVVIQNGWRYDAKTHQPLGPAQ